MSLKTCWIVPHKLSNTNYSCWQPEQLVQSNLWRHHIVCCLFGDKQMSKPHDTWLLPLLPYSIIDIAPFSHHQPTIHLNDINTFLWVLKGHLGFMRFWTFICLWKDIKQICDVTKLDGTHCFEHDLDNDRNEVCDITTWFGIFWTLTNTKISLLMTLRLQQAFNSRKYHLPSVIALHSRVEILA